MLHTLRGAMANDSLWFAVLRGIQEAFRYATVTTEDVVAFVNRTAGADFTPFFNQYLRRAALPRLDVMLSAKGPVTTARYRWKAEEEKFALPVRVTTAPGRFSVIRPTSSWQTLELGAMNPAEFQVDTAWAYIDTQIRVIYQDPD